MPTERRPTANWVLLALIAAVSVAAWQVEGVAELLGLTRDPDLGFLLHALVHADTLHLTGNLLALWVFGNAVCARFGGGPYVVAFIGFEVVAALVHLLFDGRPAIGASGAIYGVVGVFGVLYPTNAVKWFWLFWIQPGRFETRAWWLIALWVALDVMGLIEDTGPTAHAAHLGGFVAGAAFAVLAVRKGWLGREPGERNLFDLFGWKTCLPERRGVGMRR